MLLFIVWACLLLCLCRIPGFEHINEMFSFIWNDALQLQKCDMRSNINICWKGHHIYCCCSPIQPHPLLISHAYHKVTHGTLQLVNCSLIPVLTAVILIVIVSDPLCVCLCVCVCSYVCMCLYVYVCVCFFVCMHMCMHVCVCCACMCVCCAYVCIYMCVYMRVCMCVCICVYACSMCVCAHIVLSLYIT